MKLSPITIPYRAFQRASSVVILAFFVAGSDAGRAVGGPVAVFALAVAAVLATLAYELVRYERFEYELTADTFDIRSGVIRRRERELPYRRIQNVDVTRNVVARLLGVAAVGLETAGGSRTEGSIRYVSATEAERLQREIQRRARRSDETEGRQDEGALEEEPDDEEELFAITPGELGLAGALSFDARVVGAISLLGPGSVPFLSGALSAPVPVVLVAGVILGAGLLVAAWMLGVVVAVVNYYGFRLSRAGDELRYERGLFGRYSGSIPLGKVQTVAVEDNPLKRAFGYATLTVETAGYAPGRGSGRSSQVAVPIASRDRIDALAREIEPVGELSFERPPKRTRRRYVARYLIALGALAAVAYAADPYAPIDLPWYAIAALAPLALPAAHLKWRHRGYRLGADHVVTRNGFWNRSTRIVPYYRVQTVVDSRTIFQRRWGLATVVVDTAGSLSLVGHDAAAVDVEVATAVELRERLSERLQASLAERRHEQRTRAGALGSTARG